MSDDDTAEMESILLDAKKEYSKQIVGFLTPALYDELYFLWKNAVDEDARAPMRRYQDLLEEIAEWDESKKLQITDRCIEKSGCKFLEDLLTAVFVAHTKVLMSIRNKSKVSKDSYKLQVPTSNRFVYECLVQCARDFWKSPYLFYQNEADNKIDKIQIQKNLRIAEGNVKDAVMETIRNLLPIKDVLGSVLEMNEEGGVVVEVANQPRKETLIKESSHEADADADNDVNDNVDVEDTKTPSITVPVQMKPQVSTKPRVQMKTNEILKEIQGGLGREKPVSFADAELGSVPGRTAISESKVDMETDDEAGDDTNVVAEEETDASRFDWNTIVVGPVDEMIDSSLQEDIESLDLPQPPLSSIPVKTEEDDILGAVEEL